MKLPPNEKYFLILWIMANAVGWILGVIVALMLAALQETIHLGNAVYIGLGMGWTVGLAQWLVARKWFGATIRWMWAPALGMTTSFLFADLLRLDQSVAALPLFAAIGGLLTGLLQKDLPRSRSSLARRWAIVSAVAWMCPALLVAVLLVPGHPRTLLESVRNLGSIASGGVVLGIITGVSLVSFVHAESTVSQ